MLEDGCKNGTPRNDALLLHQPVFARCDLYGERRSYIRPDNDYDDIRTTDHEFDQKSGFNYMKGRYQLPTHAKFNRPDPMRDWDWLRPNTINLYQYCGNDPINRWDPLGLVAYGGLLDPSQQTQVLEELANVTGYTTGCTTNEDGTVIQQGLYFDDSGYLQIAEDASFEGGSEEARMWLDAFIDDPFQVNFYAAPKYWADRKEFAFASGDVGNKDTLIIDFADFASEGKGFEYSSGFGGEFSLGITLFHEMHHAFTGSQDDRTLGSTGGPAVEFANTIRGELGLGIREEYVAPLNQNQAMMMKGFVHRVKLTKQEWNWQGKLVTRTGYFYMNKSVLAPLQ